MAIAKSEQSVSVSDSVIQLKSEEPDAPVECWRRFVTALSGPTQRLKHMLRTKEHALHYEFKQLLRDCKTDEDVNLDWAKIHLCPKMEAKKNSRITSSKARMSATLLATQLRPSMSLLRKNRIADLVMHPASRRR